MKQKILFLMPAASGHLNSAFALARILKGAEYKIYFALPALSHGYVIQHGFETITMEGLPFISKGEMSLGMANDGVKYLDNLLDRFYDKLYRIRAKAIEHALAQSEPDIVLLDSFQSTDFLILYPYLKQNKVRFAFIQTMFSFRQQPDSLPLNSNLVPGKTTNYDFQWRKYYFGKWLKSTGESIKYFGKSNDGIIRRKFRDQGISPKYSINRATAFRVGFNNTSEFVTMPQELEFSKYKDTNQHYLGALVDRNRERIESESSERYLPLLDPKRTMIYCSFGTIYQIANKKKAIVRQISTILRTAEIFSDIEFVVCICKDYSRQIPKIPKNVLFFENVPQLQILSKASVFITHGGAQSVKESIRSHVPMIVYPIWWDQPGIAARVAYYGLGLMGVLGKDSTDELSKKLTILLTNPAYKKRVEEFDRIVCDKYNDDQVLKIFEQVIDTSFLE